MFLMHFCSRVNYTAHLVLLLSLQTFIFSLWLWIGLCVHGCPLSHEDSRNLREIGDMMESGIVHGVVMEHSEVVMVHLGNLILIFNKILEVV
jgi:hypothetical protein